MKRFSLRALTALLICLLMVISCQHEDEKSDGPVFVEVKVQLDSRHKSMGPNYTLSYNIQSALISAVPESFYPLSPSINLAAGFDNQLLNLADNTVTLNVPLNTPIRIAKIAYTTVLTVPQMLAGGTEPGFIGMSDAFTLTAGTTSKTVEVPMETVAGGGPALIGGTIQGSELNLDGAVSWHAGDGTAINAANGILTSAKIPYPYGITTNGTHFFVTSVSRHVIMKIDKSTGEVKIIAGSDGVPGSDDNSTGISATLNGPTGISADENVAYISDQNSHLIRRITLTIPYQVETLAGTGSSGYNDADGTAAQFDTPYGMTYDDFFVYIADRYNCAIRRMLRIPPYTVSNLAGSAISTCGNVDGTGTAARFDQPLDVAMSIDKTKVFVADSGNGTIRMIDIASRVVTTLATGFTQPRGVSSDGTNMFVTDIGSQLLSTFTLAEPGIVSTLAGDGTSSCMEGTGSGAQLWTPAGIANNGINIFMTIFGCHVVGMVQ